MSSSSRPGSRSATVSTSFACPCEMRSFKLTSPSPHASADMFPLQVFNSEGEALQDRMNATGSKVYQGTVVSAFPNFFWLMGPNTTTGHSSVVFTSECQLSLAFHMLRPVLEALAPGPKRGAPRLPTSPIASSSGPVPYVEVTPDAEAAQYAELRKEMRNKTWETNGGVSWYTDKQSGLCTVSLTKLTPRKGLLLPHDARLTDNRAWVLWVDGRRCTRGRRSTSGARRPSRTMPPSAGRTALRAQPGGAGSGGTDPIEGFESPLLSSRIPPAEALVSL